MLHWILFVDGSGKLPGYPATKIVSAIPNFNDILGYVQGNARFDIERSKKLKYSATNNIPRINYGHFY